MVFNFTLIAHNGINYEKGEITMIDSNYTETLYDVIQQFREYITQNHGSDSQTAQAYLRIADDFQMHVKDKAPLAISELAIQEYYSLWLESHHLKRHHPNQKNGMHELCG